MTDFTGFNDRRVSASPSEDDYATPVTRTTLIEANDRVRRATPEYHLDGTNTGIRTLAVQRHRARNDGRGDFDSVGSYLEFVQGMVSSP